MPGTRDGVARVSLGSTKEIGLRLVADGRFENLSEACRASLRRLAEDARVKSLTGPYRIRRVRLDRRAAEAIATVEALAAGHLDEKTQRRSDGRVAAAR